MHANTERRALLPCSVQYRDAQGKWTPAAVKCMDPVHKASVKREVKCLKASQHSNHIPALLSADRAKCDGVHSRFIAMRWDYTPDECILMAVCKQCSVIVSIEL